MLHRTHLNVTSCYWVLALKKSDNQHNLHKFMNTFIVYAYYGMKCRAVWRYQPFFIRQSRNTLTQKSGLCNFNIFKFFFCFVYFEQRSSRELWTGSQLFGNKEKETHKRQVYWWKSSASDETSLNGLREKETKKKWKTIIKAENRRLHALSAFFACDWFFLSIFFCWSVCMHLSYYNNAQEMCRIWRKKRNQVMR